MFNPYPGPQPLVERTRTLRCDISHAAAKPPGSGRDPMYSRETSKVPNGPDFTEDVRAKLFHDNAARLLKLPAAA